MFQNTVFSSLQWNENLSCEQEQISKTKESYKYV